MSTLDQRVAEAQEDLRRLRENPTPEDAREVLGEWRDRQNTYDTTQTAWRRS